MIDPYGQVFDAITGLAVNGARITLLDATTGQAAQVWGDDGTSSYPSTVDSGAVVTDSGGASYAVANGGFRFPVVAPGDYRLEVIAPAGYLAPSTESIAQLQMLPGAPFELSDASFGLPFGTPGPTLGFDIPVDPFAGELYLQKVTAVRSPHRVILSSINSRWRIPMPTVC